MLQSTMLFGGARVHQCVFDDCLRLQVETYCFLCPNRCSGLRRGWLFEHVVTEQLEMRSAINVCGHARAMCVCRIDKITAHECLPVVEKMYMSRYVLRGQNILGVPQRPPRAMIEFMNLSTKPRPDFFRV